MILDINGRFFIFDGSCRFRILDMSGRFWILDNSACFLILDTGGRFFILGRQIMHKKASKFAKRGSCKMGLFQFIISGKMARWNDGKS